MTPDQVSDLLANTALAASTVFPLATNFLGGLRDPLEPSDAIGIKLPHFTDMAASLEAWAIMRDLVDQTGAWPILTNGMETPVAHGDPYIRVGATFDEIASFAHTQPTRRARDVHQVQAVEYGTIPAWLSLTETPPQMPDDGYEWPESLARKAAHLQEIFGVSPTEGELRDAVGPDGRAITITEVADWWIHNWTMANLDHDRVTAYAATQQVSLIDAAFENSDTIVLLPLAKPEAAAALSHFGLHDNPQMHLLFARLIQDWHVLWDAEPVHHQGISLGFHVKRPPQTIEEALPLAIEHVAVGPAALYNPGWSIYEYAYSLVGDTAWDLMDRP